MHVHPALRGVSWPVHARALESAELTHCTSLLAGRPDLWRGLVRHDPERRWYEQVVLTDAIEVWLIGWTPGQFTPPHDHGGAQGSFAVTAGDLVEDVYDGGDLVHTGRFVHAAGSAVGFDAGHVHRVANEGRVNATSIHAYSPPGMPMRHHAATVTDLLERARARLRRLEPMDAAGRIDEGALLVDIRPAAQREREGEIPGAIVLERNVLEWRLDPSSPWRIPEVRGHAQEMIVICSEGYTSSLAAAALQELGVRRATDVVGGYQAWARAGLPVTLAAGLPM
jgi:rhodanese-related sulfurtransferase/predicted metal-dependent enzyme (double-stranded beta helix superfamily)